jgi:hypothetical protein
MNRLSAVLLLLTAACGPYRVEVAPVTITHKISLEELSEYFASVCKSEFDAKGLPADQEEAYIKACSDQYVLDFIHAIGASAND